MRIAIDCRRILPDMSGLGTYTQELIHSLVPLCLSQVHTVELFVLPTYPHLMPPSMICLRTDIQKQTPGNTMFTGG